MKNENKTKKRKNQGNGETASLNIYIEGVSEGLEMMEIFEEIMSENFPEFKKNSRPQNERVPITIQKKTHVLIFFWHEMRNIKACPSPIVKTSSKEEHISKKKKSQNKTRSSQYHLHAQSIILDLKQQINIFKCCRKKIFESRFFIQLSY